MSKWGLFHCKQQLHTPPQSPDINVIENLWVTLETVVPKHQIRNKAHLKQVLQEEWDKISPDTTKKGVELGLSSNPGEDMDVCKCTVSSRHGGTLNSRRAASPLVRLVAGNKRWEAPNPPPGCSPSKLE
ncbi:transposable element Tcb1 transposase [Trichonephila clavipes]|nr:transposable element Tcb1 transposase [Trichonephila clavipes]